jgi:hypothetical protein
MYLSCSDLHEYNFVTYTWSVLSVQGQIPRPRYRTSFVVNSDNTVLFLFGGHDGNRHLNDTFAFHLDTHV